MWMWKQRPRLCLFTHRSMYSESQYNLNVCELHTEITQELSPCSNGHRTWLTFAVSHPYQRFVPFISSRPLHILGVYFYYPLNVGYWPHSIHPGLLYSGIGTGEVHKKSNNIHAWQLILLDIWYCQISTGSVHSPVWATCFFLSVYCGL